MRDAVALVAVVFFYFVFARLGPRLASINPSASRIWRPKGLALAAILLGAFAASLTTAGTLETAAAIAAGMLRRSG